MSTTNRQVPTASSPSVSPNWRLILIVAEAVADRPIDEATEIIASIVAGETVADAAEIILATIEERPVEEQVDILVGQETEHAAAVIELLELDDVVGIVEAAVTAGSTEEIAAIINDVPAETVAEVLLGADPLHAAEVVHRMAEHNLNAAAHRVEAAIKKKIGETDSAQAALYSAQIESIVTESLTDAERADALVDLFIEIANLPNTPSVVAEILEVMDIDIVNNVVNAWVSAGALYELRNNDIDLMLEWILLAHRYGIDHISAVGILRWLMQLYEKGLITTQDTDGIPMEWGSREAMLGMLKKIVYREGFGNILADGILPAAKKIGRGSEDYADHMKGLPQYSPYMRGNIIPLKGHALALVISPRGDTMRTMFGREIFNETFKILESRYGKDRAVTYTNDIRRMTKEMAGTEEAALPERYEGKAKVVVASEDKITINDCTGACKISGGQYDRPFNEKYQAALISAGTGIETDVYALNNFAKTVRTLERAFNVREGMTRDTDSLPKGYMDQPIEAGLFKGEVLDSKKFEKMKDEYYALRGWDLATGIPTRETLEQTGLKDVARELEKQGKLPAKKTGR